MIGRFVDITSDGQLDEGQDVLFCEIGVAARHGVQPSLQFGLFGHVANFGDDTEIDGCSGEIVQCSESCEVVEEGASGGVGGLPAITDDPTHRG